jgi:methyl coenzyme M reductase alpha subunit
MITICHPVDDLELLFLRSALQAADIPHFVVGEHFGSLYPGMQIPAYNERSVRVPAGFVEDALSVVEQVRSSYTPTFEKLNMKSKLRMLFEGLWLGWVMPGGIKKSSNTSFNSGAQKPRAD